MQHQRKCDSSLQPVLFDSLEVLWASRWTQSQIPMKEEIVHLKECFMANLHVPIGQAIVEYYYFASSLPYYLFSCKRGQKGLGFARILV